MPFATVHAVTDFSLIILLSLLLFSATCGAFRFFSALRETHPSLSLPRILKAREQHRKQHRNECVTISHCHERIHRDP